MNFVFTVSSASHSTSFDERNRYHYPTWGYWSCLGPKISIILSRQAVGGGASPSVHFLRVHVNRAADPLAVGLGHVSHLVIVSCLKKGHVGSMLQSKVLQLGSDFGALLLQLGSEFDRAEMRGASLGMPFSCFPFGSEQNVAEVRK